MVQYSFSVCAEILHEVLDETMRETASAEIQ